jgi:hypothetical protein
MVQFTVIVRDGLPKFVSDWVLLQERLFVIVVMSLTALSPSLRPKANAFVDIIGIKAADAVKPKMVLAMIVESLAMLFITPLLITLVVFY